MYHSNWGENATEHTHNETKTHEKLLQREALDQCSHLAVCDTLLLVCTVIQFLQDIVGF